MLAHNVIRPSTAVILSDSQILLIPKPNRQYRFFCIDFRDLNLVNKVPIRPIPFIQATIEIMCSKKPKYFLAMDITIKIYYQALLAKSSRYLTTFIILMGLYEWKRVPMGLKSVPELFQSICCNQTDS